MHGGLGLVLLGNGKGGFTVTPPNESGIVVPGDASAVAWGDFDRNGTGDLIFGINDDLPVMYLRQTN